jgi:hypothetical protein
MRRACLTFVCLVSSLIPLFYRAQIAVASDGGGFAVPSGAQLAQRVILPSGTNQPINGPGMVTSGFQQGSAGGADPSAGINGNSPMKTSAASGSKKVSLPMPILATGGDLRSETLSPNAVQMANALELMPSLQRLCALRSKAKLDSLEERVELLEVRDRIGEVLRHTAFDVSYVLSEIWDEQSLYNEEIGSFSHERDTRVAITNAVSFGTNGALWAVAEALAIPTYARPRFSIASGITGITAGVIPSFASALTLKEVNGIKHHGRVAPNMLAKIFHRPTSDQISYPNSVWEFLNSRPADELVIVKNRRDLIVDRWITDKNLSLGRASKDQIDVLTATKPNCEITINILSDRLAMLGQLASEIFKMNRLLLELEMVLAGEKHV